MWNDTIQYSPEAVRYPCTSCLFPRRCLVSRACDCMMSALSAALLIFSFQFFYILVTTRQAASAVRRTIGFNTQYRRHRTLPIIWVGTFPLRSVHPRGNFELILTVKMETRHPVEGQFRSKFQTICNHCGVMAA